MRRVIQQAEKLLIETATQTPVFSWKKLTALSDALAELKRHEAVAVADQWSTGQIRHKVDSTRKYADPYDCGVPEYVEGGE